MKPYRQARSMIYLGSNIIVSHMCAHVEVFVDTMYMYGITRRCLVVLTVHDAVFAQKCNGLKFQNTLSRSKPLGTALQNQPPRMQTVMEKVVSFAQFLCIKNTELKCWPSLCFEFPGNSEYLTHMLFLISSSGPFFHFFSSL
jgi:hypothetical protein